MIKRPSFCFSFVIDTLYCQTYPLASCTSAISKPLPQLQRVPSDTYTLQRTIIVS